jgi:transcriptional regulator with XRE-family HTH domain
MPSARASHVHETVGERIRRLRRYQRLSQTDLAGPGVSAAHISRLESGQRQPSLEVIRRIARRLGVSADYLETGVDLTTPEELDLALTDVELRIRLDPTDEAVERDLRALITLAQREGEAEVAARAQAALGVAAAGWGRLHDAVELLEAATAHPLVRPDVLPDVFTTLASVYRELGRSSQAIVLCEGALAELHAGEGAVRTVLATHLSGALSDVGEFARAEQVLEQEAGDLEQADPYARARIHWLLARLATMQDERRLALRHLRQAITLLRGTEDTMRLARAHLFCAEILLWGGKSAGVAKHLRAARALFPAHTEATDWGMLAGYEALLAARQRRHEEALAKAEQALAVIPEHVVEQAAALYAKALALSAKAQYESADRLFDAVTLILIPMKLWREAAAVASDRSEALRRAGRPQEAEEAAVEAATLRARAAKASNRAGG